MRNIELLAPAGGMDTLRAAVLSGADAVYCGGRFSARSEQAYFSDEELAEAADFCHLYGADLHVAVNTLIKESEFSRAVEYVGYLNEIGVDAVIIQDLGLACAVRKCYPKLSLHASTQMTVTTLSGVRLLEEAGFSRVVLARELTYSEIEYITKNAKAEIEVFVHGALCMSYSGQCLMSSIIGGRSGNRGKCAQPCRLPYELISDKGKLAQGYLLSPKDLSLYDELDKLKEIGVASLKIEGRLKRPEYVATAVVTLGGILDKSTAADNNAKNQLLSAFNRGGFTKGYFKGNLGSDMMSGVKPGNIAEGVYPDFVKEIAAGRKGRRISTEIFAKISIGMPLTVKITDCDGNEVYAKSDGVAELASKSPLSAELLSDRLKKLGQTPFICDTPVCETDGICTISASEINETRRRAVDLLISRRTQRKIRPSHKFSKKAFEKTAAEPICITVQANTAEQVKAAKEHNIDIIYSEYNGTVDSFDAAPRYNEKKTSSACLVSNLGQVYDNRKNSMYGDYRLNVYNSYTASFFSDMKSVCVSPELNLDDISNISAGTLEAIAYGKLTLMTMANCPVRASGFCKKNNSTIRLRDRKGQEFNILCTKSCTPQLINSKPIYMADKISDLIKSGVSRLRLVFTDETYEECSAVIEKYKKAISAQSVCPMAENTFTRGHFYRGVL